MSIKYTERPAKAGIEPSVAAGTFAAPPGPRFPFAVGDPYDNALAETINGPLKAEVIHRRGPWRNFDAVEYATLEWAARFNNRRLLEPTGNIPTVEAEAKLHAALEQSDMAAQLRSISLQKTQHGSETCELRLLIEIRFVRSLFGYGKGAV